MPSLFCCGPCNVYVSTGDPDTGASASTAPLYLGTAEAAPSIEITPHYMPLCFDIGGPTCPSEYLFTGEEATILFDLNRWNEAVYAAMVARPNTAVTFGPGAITRGRQAAGDVGTLMSREGRVFDAWLQFPYQTKAAYSSQPSGYHFFACFCLGPDLITPGTRASKRRVILRAMRVYQVSDGTWRLYDDGFSGIPSVPPTSPSGVGSASS